MSSPGGTQVHPSNSKSSPSGRKTSEFLTTNKGAWQDRQHGNSLGRRVGLQVAAFTSGFSSEEDSDSEGGVDMPRGMTRSLGRKEMTGLPLGIRSDKFSSVSERSAAYRELITLSQNSWKQRSPRHSAMKISDGSDTSPVQSRIEMNPFLQLDKQGRLVPSDFGREKPRNNVSAQANGTAKKDSTPPPKPSSPTISGMSVQMRIKMWAEKEQKGKTTTQSDLKLTHRRSLQTTTLLGISEGSLEKSEKTAHSDDESIMNKSITMARENVYEEIEDKAEFRSKVEEASSSSDETIDPNQLTKTKSKKKEKKAEKKESPKMSKKNSSPDLNSKRSIWKIKSPLPKRKNKVKKESKEEGMSQVANSSPNNSPPRNKRPFTKKRKSLNASREDEVVEPVVDDVFSPVDSNSGGKILDPDAESEDTLPDELPSVFEKAQGHTTNRSMPPRISSMGRSISKDILNIIDSFGSIEETHPSVPADHTNAQGADSAGNSESGSDLEETESSLDMTAATKLAFKRRGSDGSRVVHGVNHHGSKGRKGSAPSLEQNAEGSLIATALMYADAVWDREAMEKDELSFRVGDVIEILDMTDDVWWHGSVGTSSGWFPSTFVRLRVGQDSDGEGSDSGETKIEEVVSDPPVEVRSENTKELADTSDSAALDQRLSNPTPDPVPPAEDESADKPSATLPRNFPRQQGGTTRRRMTIRRKDPSSSTLPKKLTPEEVRAKIIEEILSTERDYVNHLEDIIEGYLKRCLDYNTLFNEEQIETIFSNIKQVYSFQRDFLQDLEARIKPGQVAESEIGEVFVVNQHGFKVYSQYCNNHPHAVNEMSCLQENEQYCFFFESCRLLRNLQDISLEGFLLTPVQKICKYPLQLSELLKYTSEDHQDHPHVIAAQKAMKEVAMHINEQKRRIENMGKIGCWQRTIEGWKGPDVLETSTELIQSGELHKISKGHSQERHFFLFDHQLVYCKKDTIGGKLCYKGRVDLDHCQIADITDSSVLHGSTPVKNCWRMNNKAKDNKWYIIYARTPQLKEEWMRAFERERERVKEDEEKGFHVSMKMKRAAVALCSDDSRRRGKSVVRKHVAFSESVDVSAGNKKHTMTMSGTGSALQTRKAKSAKRKLNSVSGSSSAKVIF